MNMMQADLFGAAPRKARVSIPRDNAQARRRNGQYKAVKKAGSLWVREALKKLEQFIKDRKADAIGSPTSTAEFTFEEFRARSEIEGWPLPSSVNAWGALPKIAADAKLCEYTGRVAYAKRVESHGRLVKVWRAL